MYLPWYVTCALAHDMVISTLRKRSQPACTRDKIAKKNTDIGAAKVGPAMAGPAGPVPPPLHCRDILPYELKAGWHVHGPILMRLHVPLATADRTKEVLTTTTDYMLYAPNDQKIPHESCAQRLSQPASNERHDIDNLAFAIQEKVIELHLCTCGSRVLE